MKNSRKIAWILFILFWWAYPIYAVGGYVYNFVMDSVDSIEKHMVLGIKLERENSENQA